MLKIFILGLIPIWSNLMALEIIDGSFNVDNIKSRDIDIEAVYVDLVFPKIIAPEVKIIQPVKVDPVKIIQPVVKKKEVVEKEIIQPVKVKVIQPTKPKLKTVSFKILGFGKDDDGNSSVLIVEDGNTFLLSEKDMYRGSEVISISNNYLTISGYKPIIINFVFSHDYHSDLISTITHDNGESIVNNQKLTNSSEENATSLIPAVIKTKETPVNKIKRKSRVLFSVVTESINNPKNFFKYFSISKGKSGYNVLPKGRYFDLFHELGFKIGDEIIKINSKSIKDSSFLGLLSLSSAKKLRLLILNDGRYRILSLNLLDVYKF